MWVRVWLWYLMWCSVLLFVLFSMTLYVAFPLGPFRTLEDSQHPLPRKKL